MRFGWMTIPGAGCLLAVLALSAPHAGSPAMQSDEQPSSSEVHHGLEGRYYARESFERNEWRLLTPTGPPAAIRVDPQIAFGRDQAFLGSQGSQISWAPIPGLTMGVVWRGYIRFPQSGTYYLTTASRNSSAVYLNQARVALSRMAGYIPSELFGYRDPVIKAASNADENTYLVPIEVDDARVYPIEVRYVADNRGSIGFGIDLYWVTPDAARDASGVPIAEIVPSEVLYVEPPEGAEMMESPVSAPHTTIASDFLYFPIWADSFATLTIRVADAQGRPLEGKRIHVSTTSSYSRRDIVMQPAEPTDERGIAIARVQPAAGLKSVDHTSRYIATVLGDYVDAGQRAEMLYYGRSGSHFLPFAFAPYYDGKNFLIAPQPLAVGQEATFTVPLTNRQDQPYEVYIRLASSVSNIGLPSSDWNPIGRSESVVLEPGETEELSMEWTPEYEIDHMCFEVTVWGKPESRSTAASPWPVRLANLIPAPAPAWAQEGDFNQMERRQQNVEGVHEIASGPGLVEPGMFGGQSSGPTEVVRCSGNWCVNPETGAVYKKTRVREPTSGDYIYPPAELSPIRKFSLNVQRFTEMIVGKEEKTSSVAGGKG